MENNKSIFLKLAIVAVLGSAAFLGCKKTQEIELKQDAVGLKQEALIIKSSLTEAGNYKTYLGKLFHLDTTKIKYDSNQQVFVMDNGNIPYEEVKDLYEKHPIVQYLNGKPI